MNNTSFRLNESTFFLNNMESNKNKEPLFSYYLDAYLSSARSILWIMHSEYNNVPGWKDWFERKETTEYEEKLLKGITLIRNSSLKQKPLTLKRYITIGDDKSFYDITEKLERFDKHKIDITIKESNDHTTYCHEDNNSLVLRGKLKNCITVEEFKNKDILQVCLEYNKWLTSILNECIQQFGSNQN